MTPLEALIRRQIQATGPMTVADYMAVALSHPEHGYYVTRDPLGSAGDFITAPEVSQMFGELIGLCLAQSWMDQGAPTPFALAELGPGRGTLMTDMLRATRAVTGFRPDVHFVETSPALRSAQRATVPAATWHDSVETLPNQPTWIVANEFFDALPIRQFVRDGPGWRERVLGLDGDQLSFGLTGPAPLRGLEDRIADTTDGDMVEVSGAAGHVVTSLAPALGSGGALLVIDYGDWRSLGNTLQAVHRHSSADPLWAIGEADLTAHVDFEHLALAGTSAGLVHSSLTPQGMFLERLGIVERARALASTLSGAEHSAHVAGFLRLTRPEEMGTLFKVMGFTAEGAPMLPGLSP